MLDWKYRRDHPPAYPDPPAHLRPLHARRFHARREPFVAGAARRPSRRAEIQAAGALDGYILDFVCFDAKLIVEVDGGQHSEAARDAERDRHFAAKGFRTLRFWNDDVEKGIDGVCMMILRAAGRA
jgi:hypothetical protein